MGKRIGLGIYENSSNPFDSEFEWTPSPPSKFKPLSKVIDELEQDKIDASLHIEELIVEFLEGGNWTYTKKDLLRMDKWIQNMEKSASDDDRKGYAETRERVAKLKLKLT